MVIVIVQYLLFLLIFQREKLNLPLKFNNDKNSLGLSNIAATVLELIDSVVPIKDFVPEYMNESLIDKSQSPKDLKWGQKMFNEVRKYTAKA